MRRILNICLRFVIQTAVASVAGWQTYAKTGGDPAAVIIVWIAFFLLAEGGYQALRPYQGY